MTHPRLSVSQMCTYSWSFVDDLALWQELDVHGIGLLVSKMDRGLEEAAAALQHRSMNATTVITGNFDLAEPRTWDTTRAGLNDVIDLAALVGGSPYFTPGASDGRSFDELTTALAEAVAPCVDYAASRGVRLAIEPTQRRDRSFVHTIADGIGVAERTGLGLIADLGNCWSEPYLEATLRRAGAHIAVVQVCDVVTDTPQPPKPGDRAVPGDGNLAVDKFVVAALEAGYTGPFELEILGPKIEAEGYAAATRRAVDRVSYLLEEVL